MIYLSDIIQEIMKQLSKEEVSDVAFEGANIVLYTKLREFFLDDKGRIRDIVNSIKKRVELRPDPSISVPEKNAEPIIREILTEESGITQIFFEPDRSIVTIEVAKPGIAIGKKGDNLQRIKEETFWVPVIKRTPSIRSEIIEGVRAVIYDQSDYRRKFLNKTGQRIYNGWLRQKKEEWIRITYLGAARQVGRSAILLQTPESRILLDCGIDPSNGANPYPYLEAPEFRVNELDAIIVSHAHLDHSGFVPYLFKFGYRGPVYCTAPTRDIMSLLQLDTVKIARNEGQEPIYSSDEIKEVVKHSITLDFGEVTDITPDVRITLYNSGHILGSAMIHLHIGNGLHNLLYTADMKFAKTRLLNPAATQFPRLETLMIESTYGGKENVLPPYAEQDEMLANIVIETVKRGGKVLMPTLGSGRGQEVIVMLEELIRRGRLDNVPIYIDGMVWDITAIYTAYPEFLNNTVRQQIFHKDNNPFLASNIHRVGSQKERKKLIEDGEPCIILATSGMLVGGPSVQYLQELGENPKNSLVFTCYQAEGSLGKRIKEGLVEVNFKSNGKMRTVPLRLDVNKIEISAHSDRRELMNFLKRVNPKPRRVLINHGEQSRCLDLARSIHQQFRIETVTPRNLDAIRIR